MKVSMCQHMCVTGTHAFMLRSYAKSEVRVYVASHTLSPEHAWAGGGRQRGECREERPRMLIEEARELGRSVGPQALIEEERGGRAEHRRDGGDGRCVIGGEGRSSHQWDQLDEVHVG